MKTIGLIGGVASGKSLVAQLFAELGAGLLDADRAGHEVLSHDPAVRQLLLNRWGSSILAPDGSIDRAAIAACVFADSEKGKKERDFLESLLHPRIAALVERWHSQFAAEGRPAVVLDAPLLLEVGWKTRCDILVMVEAPADIRRARAAARGWSPAEFDRREAAQWSLEKKRAVANVTLANAGTPEELRTAVRNVWEKFVAS